MRVLLAGATGFLGSVTLARLRDLQFDVIATGRRQADDVVACNLADPNEVLHLLDSVRPDAIINCAARVDFTSNSQAQLYHVNTLMPSLAASWCSRGGAYLLQVSTIAIYGVGVPQLDADTPLLPDTDYGRSKLLADQLIETSGCRSAVIRFAGIFGIHGPSHLGLNSAIKEALRGKRPFIIGRGEALRSYIFVDDAASIIAHALRAGWSGVYLAGGADCVSIASMMQIVCDVFLPGQVPIQRTGPEATDQIIVSSQEVPPRHSFKQALEMIRESSLSGGHSR